MNERIFYYLFGAGLIITGLVLIRTGGFELPTRHPPKTLKFFGLSYVLFSISPLMVGWCLTRLGIDSSRRDDLLTKFWFISGILAMCLALITAQKS
jgi:hypothetical protein